MPKFQYGTQPEVICTFIRQDFILTDEHTFRLCLPLLQDIALLKDAEQIVIGPEDMHKNLETLAYVWNQLSNRGATRHSLLINLGGGMVTDLGGFAAATFKRGIACINIPTTLLSMIDAAVGGKPASTSTDSRMKSVPSILPTR